MVDVREIPRSQKLSRLGYAEASSKNIRGDRGPNKSYWEIGYTEEEGNSGLRFKSPIAEAEYVEYVNYKGGDSDLEGSSNVDKKVQGNRKGPAEYDLERRKTLKMLKAEHKKLKRMGPDRQDFPKNVDEWREAGIRAGVRRDVLAAEQAIEENDDVGLPEENMSFVEEERDEKIINDWRVGAPERDINDQDDDDRYAGMKCMMEIWG